MLQQITIRPFIPLSLLFAVIYVAYSNHLAWAIALITGLIIFAFHLNGTAKKLLNYGLYFSILFLLLAWVHRRNKHYPLEIKSNKIEVFLMTNFSG